MTTNVWIVKWGTFGMVAYTKQEDAEKEVASLQKRGWNDASLGMIELLSQYQGD